MRVRRALSVPAAAIVAALGISACGDDDFPNENRPPAPIELTANVTDAKVVVSPSAIGAGPVVLVASNQSKNEATLNIEGPTTTTGTPIPPGGVGRLQADLEQGTYVVTSGEESSARPGRIKVGAERRSSQNDLLLP